MIIILILIMIFVITGIIYFSLLFFYFLYKASSHSYALPIHPFGDRKDPTRDKGEQL